MDVTVHLVILTYLGGANFAHGIKFSAESFAEISLLAKEGKYHLESLSEKAKVPQFGSCWTNAISDLQIGCKFLSENIQSDLALRFTDCFLQMSGHEPLVCDHPRSACLQKLTDRAFNAYTEFYTHTQSICYFLQSQLWHEETEKTIDKLSTTSLQVSQQLEEAEKIQEKLLNQQKESLFLQHDLIDNSKNVVSTLQLSQDRINVIMKDFQTSASEQKELLLELFDYLVSFKSWAADELSWFSSTVFFVTAAIISFLFTSVSRTRGARMFIFIIFSFNYLLERFLNSLSLGESVFINSSIISTNSLSSWIWFCRKFCIFLSVILILYSALSFYDYNALNYQLLLEIKNQNLKILNHFAMQTNNHNNLLYQNTDPLNHSFGRDMKKMHRTSVYSSSTPNHSQYFNNFKTSGQYSAFNINTSDFYPQDVVDSDEVKINSELNIIPQEVEVEENEKFDNVSMTSEKVDTRQVRSVYNLRSTRFDKKFQCA